MQRNTSKVFLRVELFLFPAGRPGFGMILRSDLTGLSKRIQLMLFSI